MRSKDQIVLEKLYQKIIEDSMSFSVDSDVIGNVGYGDIKDRYLDDVYEMGVKFENIVWDILKKKHSEEEIEKILDGGNIHPVTVQSLDDDKSANLIFDINMIPSESVKTIVSAIKYYIDENNIKLLEQPYEGDPNYPYIKRAWIFPMQLTKPEDFDEKNPPIITLSNANMYVMLRVLDIGGSKMDELKTNYKTELNTNDLSIKIDQIINNENYLSRFARKEVIQGGYHNVGFGVKEIQDVLKQLKKLVDWSISRDVQFITVNV